MNIPHSSVNWKHPHWNRFGIAIVVLWFIALGVRLPHLDERPMHTDEAVQADKAGVLWTTGKYKYDPEEYHGPSLYYFTIPLLELSGVQNYAQSSESNYRLVTVLFGAGLVFLLLLTIDGLGPWASVWAAAVVIFVADDGVLQSLLCSGNAARFSDAIYLWHRRGATRAAHRKCGCCWPVPRSV